MISAALVAQVSRNELTPGGIVAAISAISDSSIGPGPLGMAETSPRADAPCRIASCASSMLLMQQIFTRGLLVGCISRRSPHRREELLRAERAWSLSIA